MKRERVGFQRRKHPFTVEETVARLLKYHKGAEAALTAYQSVFRVKNHLKADQFDTEVIARLEKIRDMRVDTDGNGDLVKVPKAPKLKQPVEMAALMCLDCIARFNGFYGFAGFTEGESQPFVSDVKFLRARKNVRRRYLIRTGRALDELKALTEEELRSLLYPLAGGVHRIRDDLYEVAGARFHNLLTLHRAHGSREAEARL